MEQLGSITGSGCMTGTLVATFCAGARLAYFAQTTAWENESRLVQGDMLLAALAGYVFHLFHLCALFTKRLPIGERRACGD